MRDVFVGRNEDLERIASQFTMVEEQVGCVVAVNGEAVGLDCFSSPAVYRNYFTKLIRSYAMEAILAFESSQWGDADAVGPQLLQECDTCEETTFEGVSLGTECRYTGSTLIGTALVDGDGWRRHENDYGVAVSGKG